MHFGLSVHDASININRTWEWLNAQLSEELGPRQWQFP